MTSNLTQKGNRNWQSVHQIIELVVFVSTRLEKNPPPNRQSSAKHFERDKYEF